MVPALMAIWLADHRLLVTAAPGTGSTSLLDALSGFDDASAVPVDDVVVDGVTVLDQKHATASEVIGAELFSPPTGTRIVTTVRNPFDYWPSEWERTRRRWVGELRNRASWVYRQEGMIDRIVDAVEMDFSEWVVDALASDTAQRRQYHLNAGHVDEADIVLRMEHLGADLSVLIGRPVEVPHYNRTAQRRPYWQYYDRAARDAVGAVFRPTIERFGYVF